MELKVFQISELKYEMLPGEITILPPLFSKIKLENGSLKNIHASFFQHI